MYKNMKNIGKGSLDIVNISPSLGKEFEAVFEPSLFVISFILYLIFVAIRRKKI